MARVLTGLILAFAVITSAAYAQQGATVGVDRLYVLDCGHGTAPNQGYFAAGYNEGKPFDLSDNCYLIHHREGYLLWGTGIADKFLEITSGVPSYRLRPHWVVTRGLARQLDQLNISPSSIRYIGLTNSHIDHIGNLALFPSATILMQKSELEFALNRPFEEGMLDDARFKTNLPVTKLEGDYDVFGDGTVQIIATPSVTPGNQSLLVRLPQSGAILLSGDVIHFQYGWDHRIVPGNVWNKEKTSASFQRLTDVIAENNAKLWIEHDKDEGNARRLAPDYYQ
jgi:N-acyl homoserine lactone hydrolase